MRVTLFGATGQVGMALRRAVPSEWSLATPARYRADFAKPDTVARLAEAAHADLFINAAAYTTVDRAESEPRLAQLINAEAPAALARVAAERGIPLLHLSTDYVFDGTGQAPRGPGETTRPRCVYGRTKLAGETAVRGAGGAHAVLRTSWIFSTQGTNFVRTMLRLGAVKREITVVSDQFGGPTPAAAIARALVVMGEAFHSGRGRSGVYHFAGGPDTNWADFARAIFAEAAMNVTVRDIPSGAYPMPARRPLNSRLDCGATRAAFGIERPDWRAALGPVIHDLKEGAHIR